MVALDRVSRRRGRREFLFLQGLAGPFFAMLGQRLADHGHGVRRINFNGGDKLYWSAPNATDYRGTLKRWPAFLDAYLDRSPATDLVLFGDCRPLHAAAIKVARDRGMQVHVFEEGYIRPDYVTVEAEGVNGHSTLPRNPEEYLRAARSLPPLEEHPPIASFFNRRAREDLTYNLGSFLLTPLFPGYRTHRPWHILVEYMGWAARLLRKPSGMRRSSATIDQLNGDGRPFFVFPLQLDCDYQIRVHSGFKRIQPAIEHVLASFAAHAPADTLLVVKGHPLDNGLTDWEKKTRAVAEKLGISDRMLFIAWADIDPLVRAARGVVTVNSTTGTLALRYGVPTIVLGDAVYNVPRITHQTGLGAFWTKPQAPEAEVFDAFRRVLVDRCLVHGGYFSDDGLEMLIGGAAARIENSVPGAPAVRVAAPAASAVDGFRAASLRG
ncbi:capsular biosynthesis protein [Sphingomonas sp. AP4-R1]|uniref:capsule biosynthesis protein n=1 Tax=Sphingomonas sp. AP4-R1 TaxID=2735134 RepID=UPI001493D9FF|nr:capsular biosynthesis protein [Sphingomonas sp. AP4-R1]QJU57602.1 capsular biosynthesis protein [Sphingomonas sp. AP4-R1]